MIKVFTNPFCIWCGRELEYSEVKYGVCSKCISNLSYIDLNISCTRCGLPNSREYCKFCETQRISVDKNISLFVYEGKVKDIIHSIKFYNNVSGIGVLKQLLKGLELEILFSDRIDVIVPVPISLTSFIKRGFNLVDELFKDVALRNRKTYLKILGKKVISKEQKKLRKEERISLVRKSFFIKRKVNLEAKNVLIVDDVFTTGSTINICYELVKGLGAYKVFSLTFCRAIESI